MTAPAGRLTHPSESLGTIPYGSERTYRSRGCGDFSRSRLTWAEPRVERIAKRIAEHIDRDEETNQHDAWDDGDPPSAGEHQVVAGTDQRAERRLGHGHSEAEKGQRRFRHDGASDLRGSHHDQRREDVGQDVPSYDAKVACAERTCRPHIVLGGFDLGCGARGASEIGPFGEA